MADSVTQILKSGPPGASSTSPCSATASPTPTRRPTTTASRPCCSTNLRDGLLLRGQVGVQHLPRQPDLSGFRRQPARLQRERDTERRLRRHHRLDDAQKGTALGFIYGGSWAHCWMEWGANSWTLVQNALNAWVPSTTSSSSSSTRARFGRCGGGGFQIVTLGSDATVMAHEFGHGTGGLADEYCRSRHVPVGSQGSPTSRSTRIAQR